METILWGALGGVAALALENVGALTKLPATIWGGSRDLMSSVAYCCYEAMESINDLIAECKMEYEAEVAAIEEVRWQSRMDLDQGPKEVGYLKLVN